MWAKHFVLFFFFHSWRQLFSVSLRRCAVIFVLSPWQNLTIVIAHIGSSRFPHHYSYCSVFISFWSCVIVYELNYSPFFNVLCTLRPLAGHSWQVVHSTRTLTSLVVLVLFTFYRVVVLTVGKARKSSKRKAKFETMDSTRAGWVDYFIRAVYSIMKGFKLK